jgi:hypothetical protein
MSPYQSIQNGFDSKIIPFYIRVIFPKNGKIVPGLHGQATGKLYHLRLRVECTLFYNLQSRARTHAVLVIGLYELLDPTT